MSKLLINLELTLEYNPDTQEVSIVNQKSVKTKTSTSKINIDNNPIPTLMLLHNKYELNPAAVSLLGIPDPGTTEVRLDIRYRTIHGKSTPIIGQLETFGSGTGNKVTKSYTVSFRGKANELLSKHGTNFTLENYQEGLFILKGEKEIIENKGKPEIKLEQPLTYVPRLNNSIIKPNENFDNEKDDFDFLLNKPNEDYTLTTDPLDFEI